MKPLNILSTILLALCMILMVQACNNDSSREVMDTVVDEIHYDTVVADTLEADPNPLPEDVDETPVQEVKATAQSAPAARPVAQKRETLYISTHAAQGEVYGSVTMTGNKGRGTIHDEHENTLSISVTRHGNELFGIDQNGRQYVFKI